MQIEKDELYTGSRKKNDKRNEKTKLFYYKAAALRRAAPRCIYVKLCKLDRKIAFILEIGDFVREKFEESYPFLKKLSRRYYYLHFSSGNNFATRLKSIFFRMIGVDVEKISLARIRRIPRSWLNLLREDFFPIFNGYYSRAT